MSTTPLPQQEEAARGELYGVLAALFYAPPDAALLAALRDAGSAADDSPSALQSAWTELVAAAQALEPPAIAAEYDALFGGVGRPDIYLFGSHYLAGFLNEKPLVNLRGDLARLGLARADAVRETEDHIACLFDAMRHLIAVHPENGTPLADQRLLFERHIAPWAEPLCDAIAGHPAARFYESVAQLMRVFAAIEQQAFELLEAAPHDSGHIR